MYTEQAWISLHEKKNKNKKSKQEMRNVRPKQSVSRYVVLIDGIYGSTLHVHMKTDLNSSQNKYFLCQ